MVLERLWVLPIIAFLLMPTTFFICYAIALANDHISALWPYIGDVGTLAPESCIFSQLFNMASLMVAMCMYWRHRQIVAFYLYLMASSSSIWRISSKVLLALGLASASGMSITANFQELRFKQMHFFGVFLMYFCGVLYLWGQTVFSYKMHSDRRTMAHLRLLLSLAASLLFMASVCSDMVFYILDYNGGANSTSTLESNPAKLHRSTKNTRYIGRLVSSVSEWLLSTCICLYILSYAIELRLAVLLPIKLVLPGSPSHPRISGGTFIAANGGDNAADRRHSATEQAIFSVTQNLANLAQQVVR